MRMEVQLAGPGVQHCRNAELSAEPARVVAEREQRRRGGLKQEVEYELAIADRNGAQRTRKGEDDVKVRHGQRAGLA